MVGDAAQFLSACGIIIGAGAAGLAAASALSGQGLSVLVLEARNRIGGRALTQRLDGVDFDVGCEWLHSADRNCFVPIARSLGFELAYEEPHWGEQSFNINFPISEQHAFHAAFHAFEDRLQAAARLPQDTNAADWLAPGNRWNPLIDAVSTYVSGAELSNISAYDSTNYQDTKLNWRVRHGYGALVAAFGSSCSVALNTELLTVDHSGREIMLETSRGNVRARAVICTLPTSLIADEAVRFRPPLPDKVAAAAGLPLGYAEKAMLHLDDPNTFPVDGHLFGATDRAETGSYDLRPLRRGCIQSFFGGALAVRSWTTTHSPTMRSMSLPRWSARRSGAGSTRLPRRPGATTASRAGPTLTPGRDVLDSALSWPLRWTAACFSQAKQPRPDFSPPRRIRFPIGTGLLRVETRLS
jgi:monoamine oxidase